MKRYWFLLFSSYSCLDWQRKNPTAKWRRPHFINFSSSNYELPFWTLSFIYFFLTWICLSFSCLVPHWDYFFTYVPTYVSPPTNHPGDRKFQDTYEIKTHLGSGNFGVVRLAIDKRTRKLYAIKSISKKKLTDQATNPKTNDYINEITIQKSINNEHIVRVYDWIDAESYVHIIME